MRSYLLSLFVLGGIFLNPQLSFSDQIENEIAAEMGLAPRALLVKVNPSTKTVEVFRAPKLDATIIDKSATPEATARAIDNLESPVNRIAEFKLSTHELDKDSSTEAWGRRWYNHGYRWNHWGGYSRPYYYNWNQPYSNYPGSFTYNSYYSYNYSWNYRYNNCYYGWYY